MISPRSSDRKSINELVVIARSPDIRLSIDSKNDLMLSFNYKSVYIFILILLVFIDLSISIFLTYYYSREGGGIDKMNMSQCIESSNSLLYSTGCSGESLEGQYRWTTGIIYFISTIIGVIYLIIYHLIRPISYQQGTNGSIEMQIDITEEPIIKSVYLLRNVCLFNFFCFKSDPDIIKDTSGFDRYSIKYQTVVQDWYSYRLIMGCCLPISIALTSIMWVSYTKVNTTNKIHKMIFIIIHGIIMYGLVVSTALYIINAGMLNSNSLLMFNVRGPGLQSVSLLQYSLIIITIMEFLTVSKIKFQLLDAKTENEKISANDLDLID